MLFSVNKRRGSRGVACDKANEIRMIVMDSNDEESKHREDGDSQTHLTEIQPSL